MRRKTLAAFGILPMALVASGAAQAEQFVKAHYEINVNDGDSRNSVRSAFRGRPGESERLELKPNVVEFTVLPASDREYGLVIVVKGKGQSAPAVRLGRKFRGTIGGRGASVPDA